MKLTPEQRKSVEFNLEQAVQRLTTNENRLRLSICNRKMTYEDILRCIHALNEDDCFAWKEQNQ